MNQRNSDIPDSPGPSGVAQAVQAFLKDYLGRRPEIVFAYLFGSVVDSETYLDIDVGIYVENRILDDARYPLALSMELERALDCSVDVIIMNTASDSMVYHISRGMLIVNREDDIRVDRLTSAWKRYWDFVFMRDRYFQDVAEGFTRP